MTIREEIRAFFEAMLAPSRAEQDERRLLEAEIRSHEVELDARSRILETGLRRYELEGDQHPTTAKPDG